MTASSGIDQTTGEWKPAFEGQRRPVKGEPGNTLAVKHGAYADVQLGDRVEELAAVVRELVPAYSERDEIAVHVLCLCLARLEQSATAQAGDSVSIEDVARLRQDERGWTNTVRRYLDVLGLTPRSRAKLGLHAALGQRAAMRAFEEHVEKTHGIGEGDAA